MASDAKAKRGQKWSMTTAGIPAATRAAKKDGESQWITDETKQRGVGRLRLRVSPNGDGAFYFRYFDSNGKEDSYPVGTYDEKGKAGLTLKEARDEAGKLSRLYQSGKRDLRTYLETVSADERAAKEETEKARIDLERQAVSGSLQKLMDAYIAHLKRQGKQATQDARCIFRRNVTEEFPDLAAKRAADITHIEISKVISKLIDRTAGRTAAKLRSYLRAAFAAGLAAEGDPTAHPDLHGFNLLSNPAALVPAKKLSAFNKPRERVLNEAELREFLTRLEKQTGVARDAILLSLYLGGQRSAQLVRVKATDVDLDAKELTLYDGKGNRQNPRVHLLPLTNRAAEIVDRLMKENGEKPVLITLNGKVSVRTETLSAIVTDISAAMVKEKLSREPFENRDLRRTCETMMARMGISKDIRAHVLSHGLGGVQGRHYDKHDYADEKRSALEAWDAKLKQITGDETPTNVVQLKREAK